ncbi:MAG: DedA family protein [Saprospiraceae bacterium]|nr:DedA family protein [Saprospiraceae bacterium]
MIETAKKIIDFILHIDTHLLEIANNYGTATYIILFLVVFCETGLVVTPFLPGDSLFFAAGAICATSGLNIFLTIAVCLAGAIIGNTVNYEIGRRLGPSIFKKDSKFIKKEHLEKTQEFYHKHGTKAIVLSRFLPIFRTFVPFVAGVAGMNPMKHFVYNVLGAVLWVLIFVLAGYFFGKIKFVQENFSLVIIGILVVTILPGIIAFLKNKFSSRKKEKTIV